MPKTKDLVCVKDFISHSAAWVAQERGVIAIDEYFTINGQPHRIVDGPLFLTMTHVDAKDRAAQHGNEEKCANRYCNRQAQPDNALCVRCEGIEEK